MGIVKAHRYGVSIRWRGGRLTRASASGKPSLDIATPPEFKGGIEGIWSPEELLVASAASCLAVTLAAVADAARIELDSIEVDGLGHIELSPEGRFRFVAIELALAVEAADEDPHRVRQLAEDAERLCLVSAALDVPVHVSVAIASAPGVVLGS